MSKAKQSERERERRSVKRVSQRTANMSAPGARGFRPQTNSNMSGSVSEVTSIRDSGPGQLSTDGTAPTIA